MGPSIDLLSFRRLKIDTVLYVVRANVERGREEVDRRALAGPGTLRRLGSQNFVKSRVTVNYMLGINHNGLI